MTDLSWMRPKLAELCGVRVVDGFEWPKGSMEFSDVWRPDLDVAQAIRCLEASKRELSVGYRPFNHFADDSINDKPWCSWDSERRIWEVTPSRAICLAIASALGWEKP